MQAIILVFHLLLGLALVGVVLLQRSEGGLGGLGGSGPGGGGMGGLMGGRAAANLLTRATGVLAGSFMATSIVLAILASGNDGPISIIQEEPGASEQAPTQPHRPAVPSVPTGE
jgi:preprotein translocase subunit SecG